MAAKSTPLCVFFVAINLLESRLAVDLMQTMAGPHLNLELNPGDVGHQGFRKPQQSSLVPFLSLYIYVSLSLVLQTITILIFPHIAG